MNYTAHEPASPTADPLLAASIAGHPQPPLSRRPHGSLAPPPSPHRGPPPFTPVGALADKIDHAMARPPVNFLILLDVVLYSVAFCCNLIYYICNVLPLSLFLQKVKELRFQLSLLIVHLVNSI